MILFQQDWDLYPTAIPDYNTKNQSFLKQVDRYDKMGIKNCLFPLALMQPDLVGVDPYADNLSYDIKYMIAQEAEWNPWYYLREIARIPPISGLDPVSFRANRANVSLAWCFFNHVDYLLIHPRQTGKSVSTDGITSWCYLFRLRNAKMLLITKDDSLRSDNVRRLRNMREYLPKWLIFDDRTDANNTLMVTYNTRGNVYKTAVGQNSEDAALKVGRGSTVPIIHCDEGPFIPYIDITLPAALSAGNAARDEAERNGYPYGNMYTTTAGKIDSRSGGYMYQFMKEGAEWNEAFLDVKDRHELYKVVNNSGTGRMRLVVGVFSHRQLGYTDDWLYEKISSSNSKGDAADRDYFNRWTMGSLSSPLSVAINTAIMKSEKDPEYTQIFTEGFIMKWYLPKEEIKETFKSKSLILGVDTSDAIGRDAIALTIIDSTDLSVVGATTINDSSLVNSARWMSKLLIEYPNITCIIEKKSSAMTFIDTAIAMLPAAGIDPLKRLFHRINDERGEHLSLWEEIEKTPFNRRDHRWYERFRKYFGFNTSSNSRDLLYGTVLENAAERSCNSIQDRRLSSEIRSLVMRNGRIDHSTKGNDDTVISWLMANWLLMFGKNLDYYGIDTSKLMLRAGRDGRVATPEEIRTRTKQDNLKAKVEELTEKLKNTDNLHLMITLEQELRLVSKKLNDSGDDTISIDALMNTIKKQRASKLQHRRLQRYNS
jgi:hypothetical protein